MKTIDLSGDILSAYTGNQFDLEKWKNYMDRFLPGAKELCLADMRETIDAGYSWEKDYLPVLDAVAQDPEKLEKAVLSFRRVTEKLDERITERFGRSVDAELVLYLGLCNGAGWVTPVDGKPSVLLGIEKILELDWTDTNAMTGLIFHELGHVYQEQYGVLRRELAPLPDQLLWQLFTEGVAMVFEQEIAGGPECFHQYSADWKRWCDANAALILQSFRDDLPHMTHENQRYFGDWVSFHGHGDTGYYLGARFVRFLLREDSFDRIILYGIREVRDGFERFSVTRCGENTVQDGQTVIL